MHTKSITVAIVAALSVPITPLPTAKADANASAAAVPNPRFEDYRPALRATLHTLAGNPMVKRACDSDGCAQCEQR